MKQWIILVGIICIAVASAQVHQRQGRRNHPKNAKPHRVVPEVVEEVIEEVEEPVVQQPREHRQPRLNEEEAEVEAEEPPMVPVTREEEAEVEAEEPPMVPVTSEEEEQEEVEVEELPEEDLTPREHPCNKHHCSVGKECVLDKNEKPMCVCIRKCPKNKEDRAKVCTTANVTMVSECEMHRQICLCHRQEEGCINPSYRTAELDYYGPCKEFKKCGKWESEQFPERMRSWLFIVMEELAQRDDLNLKAKKMARRAEHMKKTKKALHWSIPAIWKFCDLDHSHDDMVTFHEMIPMSAPLKGMEHCTQPFLDGCDQNNDGDISKLEWIKCLRITEEHEEDIEMTCKQFTDEE